MKLFLESDRLALREISDDDLNFLFELHADPAVMQFIRPPEARIEEAHKTLRKIQSANKYEQGLGLWICMEKISGELVGWFVLKNLDNTADIEIGYRLLKKHWGKGFATEMSKELLKYGFEKLLLKKIVGVTHPRNLASQHVLEKIGLTFSQIRHLNNTDTWIYECCNPLNG